jgi:hypothetical protein
MPLLLWWIVTCEWSSGFDSSLSWVHVFQTNLFAIFFWEIGEVMVEPQGSLYVLSFAVI